MTGHDLPSFVRDLLANRDLDAPDGRALYAYRLSEADYRLLDQRLRALARRALRDSEGTAEDRAAFVLWAAESWRRDQDPGRWNDWDQVLAPLGLGGLPRQQLYRCVERGLAFWRREIGRSAGRRRYLATLVCEGGLPLHLIRREGTTLARYFRRLLTHRQDFGDAGLEQVAEREGVTLPVTLRQETTYRLAADLIRAVWRAQELAGESPDPIAALDARQPDWQDWMPLRLDDELATRFLGGLVTDAADTARLGAIPQVRRHLERNGDAWRLLADVDLPSRLRVESLAAVIGVPAEDLPGRFALALRIGQHPPQRIALVTRVAREGQDPSLRIEAYRGAVLFAAGADAAQSISLSVERSEAGPVTGARAMPGGTELGDQPWVFADEAKGAAMLADGSCRTHHQSVLVALPPDVEFDGEAQSEWGSLREPDRRLIRIHDHTTLSGADGDRWSVRTGSDDAEGRSFDLTGQMATFTRTEPRPFLGPPAVFCRSRNGGARHHDDHGLQWRPPGTGQSWRDYLAQACGTVTVRLVEAGETLLRRRVAILPKSMSVELRPAATATAGTIVLTGIGGATVRCSPVTGATAEVQATKAPDRVEIHYRQDSAGGTEGVQVELDWPDTGPIELDLPPPCLGARFVDGRQRSLPSGEAVAVGDLVEMAAQVVTASFRGSFALLAELVTRERDSRGRIRRKVHATLPLRRIADHLHEVELRHAIDAVQRMLLADTSLDAKVRFRVEAQSGPGLPRRELLVARYQGELQLGSDAGSVSAPADRAITGLCALRLWRPSAPPVELAEEEVPAGASRIWRVVPGLDDAGPWLLLPTGTRDTGLRPRLWVVDGDDGEPGALDGPFAAVARQSDDRVRRTAWPQVIDGLAADPGHRDWTELLALVQHTASAHATSFDALRWLAAHPIALTMLLLRSLFEGGSTEVLALEEQLPFRWGWIPLHAWRIAADRVEGWQQGQFADLDAISRRHWQQAAWEHAITALEERSDLHLLVGCLRSSVLGIGLPTEVRLCGSPEGRAVIRHKTEEALMQLRREHDDLRATDGELDLPDLRSTLSAEIRSLLEHVEHHHGGSALLRAPIAAALWSLADRPPDPIEFYELASRRSVDPLLFDEIHTLCLALVLAQHQHDGGPPR